MRETELVYKKIQKLYERMGAEMAENQSVWKYYSSFMDLTNEFYSIKKDISLSDPDKKKYFFQDEPVDTKEKFSKDMHIKKYESLQKWCKSIMIVGWENIIQNNLDLIESTQEL